MDIIIDEGNTNIKIYWFENDKIVKRKIFPTQNRKNLFRSINLQADFVVVSSVVDDVLYKQNIEAQKLLIFDLNTPIPIKNNYQSPTLGKDRLALAVGAYFMFPKQNVLIIDIGTAITIDFLSSQGFFEGGNISPGINLRFQALNNYTAKLPLVKASENFDLIGKTTQQAILNGVMNGVLFEIKTYIKVFKNKFPDLKVILTGGDMKYFENKIKNHIFAEPFLLANGLNFILKFNKQKLGK